MTRDTPKNRQGTIRVTCQGAAALPLDELIEFQGDIKTLSDANAARLRSRIEKHGINAPVFVWRSGTKKAKHYILDGHQRVTVLRQMRDDGVDVPEIPVVFIDAKSRKDAAEKLLGITSQYGEFAIAELEEWASGLDIADVRIVDGEISFDVPTFEIVDEESQGQLDHVGKTTICPHCGGVIDG